MSKVYPVSNYEEYRGTRNPYGKIIQDFVGDKEFSTLLADAATENNKGKWRSYFKKPGAFLNLELGAYHGETSIHLAKESPNTAHLAVEWKYKQCFKAGKKAEDRKLENLTFLRANIARLPWMVAAGEVDRVWVLFPDPWSKRKSHHKWRLLQPHFFHMIGALLTEGKELMIKTDHAEYAEFIAASIKEAGVFDLMPEEKAAEIWSMIPPTPFERIFIRQGIKIHPFGLVRNAKPVNPPEEVKHVLALH